MIYFSLCRTPKISNFVCDRKWERFTVNILAKRLTRDQTRLYYTMKISMQVGGGCI